MRGICGLQALAAETSQKSISDTVKDITGSIASAATTTAQAVQSIKTGQPMPGSQATGGGPGPSASRGQQMWLWIGGAALLGAGYYYFIHKKGKRR